jgi:hypothetical protein
VTERVAASRYRLPVLTRPVPVPAQPLAGALRRGTGGRRDLGFDRRPRVQPARAAAAHLCFVVVRVQLAKIAAAFGFVRHPQCGGLVEGAAAPGRRGPDALAEPADAMPTTRRLACPTGPLLAGNPTCSEGRDHDGS